MSNTWLKKVCNNPLIIAFISETEIVGTCPDMAIQPYTALYSSIKGNGFANELLNLCILT